MRNGRQRPGRVSGVWPGGFHAFNAIAPGSALARAALSVRLAWLRRVIG